MIPVNMRQTTRPEAQPAPQPEPPSGRPVASGEQWLGRNAGEKRRLWERLNPRHRKSLLMLARALALRQSSARLPEPFRATLLALLEELDRLAARVEKLLAAVASRTPRARL
jgi:hypothetical protein